MDIKEVKIAVQQAKKTLRDADEIANDVADILEGRLRSVGVYRLARLKKELDQFNARTKTWKS